MDQRLLAHYAEPSQRSPPGNQVTDLLAAPASLYAGPETLREQPGMTTPLAGVTVLDFGQIYQGPYATLLMAKAGANVIKIEPPGGEPLRRRVLATGEGDTTLPMAMLNANKRAITLNLKSPRGRELLLQMAARADVLLENFSPGTMDGLGVGYDVLKLVNKRLIYATGTGFGISGPDRDNLAMDFTIQAASGIMSVTGAPDGPPMKAGPTLVDFMGGIHLYAGVTTALYQRERTGEGQLVEIAMQEAVYFTLAGSYEYHYRTGSVPPRAGNRQAGLRTAPYNTFPTTDGWVAIHVVTEAHWPNLLKAMDREDLRDDPRFGTNPDRAKHMEDTEAVVAAWTRIHTKAEVVAAAKRHRVPCAPVRNAVEVMHDPHMHARGMLQHVEHPSLGPVIMPNSPLRLHGADRVEAVPSPRLGQHNRDIYQDWLGLPDAAFSALQQDGVI
jgi:crotonobetainyl-CoA:carnitine CoA-transferase CaiB-like acyl-CoA transferase